MELSDELKAKAGERLQQLSIDMCVALHMLAWTLQTDAPQG